MGQDKATTTVDPNYDDGDKTATKENTVGATSPMDHPLTRSPVDANYSESSSPAPSTRSRMSKIEPDSKDETDDLAGVAGSGDTKYTDDNSKDKKSEDD